MCSPTITGTLTGLTELVLSCSEVALLGCTGVVVHAGAGRKLRAAAGPILSGVHAGQQGRRVTLRPRALLRTQVRLCYPASRFGQPMWCPHTANAPYRVSLTFGIKFSGPEQRERGAAGRSQLVPEFSTTMHGRLLNLVLQCTVSSIVLNLVIDSAL